MAKGVQPITKASLSTPKISGGVKPAKAAKATPPNTKAMSALFGKKASKPAVQSTPTKMAAL